MQNGYRRLRRGRSLQRSARLKTQTIRGTLLLIIPWMAPCFLNAATVPAGTMLIVRMVDRVHRSNPLTTNTSDEMCRKVRHRVPIALATGLLNYR